VRNSSNSTDSNTPTPPGTLLMMPAAMAMMNMAAKAANPTCEWGGRSEYSTPAAHKRSPDATATWAKAIPGLGMGTQNLRQRSGS
jgi:hypothetical protein